MEWRDAVIAALHDYSSKHGTRLVTRQGLIHEYLDRIVAQTGATGITPDYTMSRILQELRDEGLLSFLQSGQYLLADQPLDVTSEDMPDDAVDFAITRRILRIGDVPTGEAAVLARQRRGQDRLRAMTLANYHGQCALCDIAKTGLLVTSHISTWSADPAARGLLSNVLCLCKFHDVLFEDGYVSLTDDYRILKKPETTGKILLELLRLTDSPSITAAEPPSPEYLRKHRIRTGFEAA